MKRFWMIFFAILSIIFFNKSNLQAYDITTSFIYPVGHPFTGSGYSITQGFNTSHCDGFCSNQPNNDCGTCPTGTWLWGHTGVDLANGQSGGLIRATAPGKVVASGWVNGWGNMVRIEHKLQTVTDNIVYSQYAHMQYEPLVKIDQEVCKGEPIGYVGNTGFSIGNTGYHLHFEIKLENSNGPGYSNGDLEIINNYYNAIDFINNDISHDPPCKSLAQIEGLPEVYWLQNGKAYHIVNDTILSNMNSIPGWDKTQVYPEGTFKVLPPGFLIPSGDYKKGPDFISNSNTSNKLLIQLNKDDKIYVVENGQRRHITSLEIFEQLGYDRKDVISVAQAILDFIPEGEPISSVAYNVDAVLIIDSSGSMTSYDPANLRKAAAKIFVHNADDNDQVAIVDFDSYTKIWWPLQPLTVNRDGILAAIDKIDSSGGTNLGAGLSAGYNQLKASTKPNKKAAIFMTDGQGDYSNQAQLFLNNIDDPYDDWPVYTIGLGYGVNTTLLQNIADITGGIYFQLSDPNQLQNVYFEIANLIKEDSQPLLNTITIMFVRDTYCSWVNVPTNQDSITFLVSWPGSEVSASLKSPSGREIRPDTTDLDVYHAKGLTYELYRISKPEAGQWEINLYGVDLAPAGEEVRISVSSVGPTEPVDTTPPVISISNPLNGKTYFDQLAAGISFMVEDPESAIVVKSALLNGVPINNTDKILFSKLGENTLTVTATNEANLTSEATVTFYVDHFSWLPPIKYKVDSSTETETNLVRPKSTLPIKFAIFDEFDNFVANSSARVVVEGTTAEFAYGEGDTNIRINQKVGEDPVYIVNLHTNFHKWDYQMEVDGEYWVTVYFDSILAARTKIKLVQK